MPLSGATSASGVTQLSNAIMQVYSKEIIFASQPLLRFAQFAERKEELGVAPGQTMNLTKYSSLTGGGQLTEGTDLAVDTLTTTQIQITVNEYGKAVQVSELLLVVSFDDILASTARLLGYNYAKNVDGALRNVLLGGSNVVYGGAQASRAALTSADVMDTRAIKDAVENLAINKAPKINGDSYVCFVHPHQARKLRDDSGWINASNYGAPGQLFLGEIGRYEDVIFIETTMMRDIRTTGSIFADNEDSGTTVTAPPVRTYQATIFGDNSFGWATALPVEMRDNGVLDFGRRHGLAWYSIYGQALIESAFSYIIETA